MPSVSYDLKPKILNWMSWWLQQQQAKFAQMLLKLNNLLKSFTVTHSMVKEETMDQHKTQQMHEKIQRAHVIVLF